MVRKILLPAAALLLLALVGLHVRARYEFCALYDPGKLLGLTPLEVEARLGRPFDRTEGDSDWLYQSGMDPEATISFQNGRVVKAEFYYWRCPPFSDWFPSGRGEQ